MGIRSERRHSEETKRKIAESVRKTWDVKDPERRSKQSALASELMRGKKAGHAPAGFYFDKGYRILTMQYGHPLAGNDYCVKEHRKVLYDEIGPGPHECHWGCGRIDLGWNEIHADHKDGAKLNNDIGNLVVSCADCNGARAAAGNPIDWKPKAMSR